MKYDCTGCGKQSSRDSLAAKTVQFKTVGKPPTVIRTRTVDWLCGACLAKDPHYTQEAYDSPGLRQRGR